MNGYERNGRYFHQQRIGPGFKTGGYGTLSTELLTDYHLTIIKLSVPWRVEGRGRISRSGLTQDILTHSAPRMLACIVPQALDVIKHCYSPARFTHTFLMFMELQLSRVLNQNGY